ncbi:MAG TPA: alcohol dehydrogenase catalytic domain-containing protein [Candidatus Dormibacteraeota bacterium]|nr:alcohol dehydrogenase catalytic domain-containing protein [Candidatus Dormibacteraeota bacterium]
MRAAVWHGAGDIRVEDWPEPTSPGPGEALVEVLLAAICGTDLAEYRDGPHMIPVTRPHRLTGRRAPIVLGHEYVGRVLEVGEGVDTVRPGDRVCGDACLRCHRCRWCQRGEYNVCRLGASVGLHADGAFADRLLVPAYTLEPVPEVVADRWAAVTEPLAVGLHAVAQGRLQPGDTTVVIGYGMIGAAVACMARAAGAGQVLVLEPRPSRRELALGMGARETFDPGRVDARREILGRTGAVGADLVVDCTGDPEAFSLAVELSRRGGTVVLCGIGHRPASVGLDRLVYFERRVVGALGYRFDHRRVLSLMADGRVNPDPLLGAAVDLERIVPEGFERMLHDPEAPLRVLVSPSPARAGGGSR